MTRQAHSSQRVTRAATGLLALLVAAASSCASDPTGVLGRPAGAGGGMSAAAGSANTPGGSSPSGGAPAAGGAASGAGGASTMMQPGHAGNVDDGDLFGPDASVAVVIPSDDQGEGGAGPEGDGNEAVAHFVKGASGTATFTQTGTDVTVVIKLSNCSAGDHRFFIAEGDSCDNAGIEGGLWDGKRGDGTDGPIIVKCSNNSGTLTYTRSGKDPLTNWTVADHQKKTDISFHVLGLGDPASKDDNRPCANFF